MWLLFVTILSAGQLSASAAEETKKSSQRIGDVVITLLGIEDRGIESSGDHYRVAVGLRAENIGKQALCTSFAATIMATFGLEYRGYSGATPFRIWELLPAEKTEGEYVFSLKNGTQPLQLILKPHSQSQTCTRGKDSFSAVWHGATQLRFDLSALMVPSQQDVGGPKTEEPEGPKLRVVLSNEKGGVAKQSAVRAFSDHCPQALITTNRELASYFVELVPAGLRHSKNSVIVTNKAGDVLHDGTTMNLGNAAKDACIAILKDFGSGAGNNTPP
jgi:hypothetical protein